MTDLARAQQLFFEALGAQQAGRFDHAERLYREALAAAPDRPSILNNLATLLLQQQRHAEAEKPALRLAEVNPGEAASWLTLGNVQSGLQRHAEAAASYRRALELDPGNAGLHQSLGLALVALGRREDALAAFDSALELEPRMAEALAGRGIVLAELGHHQEGLDSCSEAAAIDPRNAAIQAQLANVLVRMMRAPEAVEACDRAIAIDPECADAFLNRGNAALLLARHDDALDDFARTQRLAPGHPKAYWNESLCRLLMGDFRRGWMLYQRGWETGQRGQQRPHFQQPSWRGGPVDGTLLVWGEQGIGDQMLFAGMLENLLPMARRLVVAVDHRLVALLQRSLPGARIISYEDLPGLKGVDEQVAMGDLGIHLRRDWTDFPAGRQGYLKADAARAAMLRRRLGGGRQLLCGISWHSNNAAVGELKSLRLADLAGLIAIPGLRCVDLQYGDTAAERRALLDTRGLGIEHADDIDNFNDIDGLAALIETCDIVVSVSNTTAHLAGALGKPALVMLPHALGRIWYWHEGRDRSPWYPSCTLLRQPAAGDWAPVIARAETLLRSMPAGNPASSS